MLATDRTERVAPYLQRLLDNPYAQENLRAGVESLRAAYRRASKRRVEPTRDEKLREEVRQSALYITEAAKALKTGRQKPKKRWGRRLLSLLGLGALGAAFALAASQDLRRKVFGDESGAPQAGDGVRGASSPEKAPV
jgi:hypothetical protein